MPQPPARTAYILYWEPKAKQWVVSSQVGSTSFKVKSSTNSERIVSTDSRIFLACGRITLGTQHAIQKGHHGRRFVTEYMKLTNITSIRAKLGM